MTRGKKPLFANDRITTTVSKELPSETINYDFEISVGVDPCLDFLLTPVAVFVSQDLITNAYSAISQQNKQAHWSNRRSERTWRTCWFKSCERIQDFRIW